MSTLKVNLTALLLCPGLLAAQSVDLTRSISALASQAGGTVGVSCSLPGSDLSCDLNPDARLPMQSVFKLPLALTVLHLTESRALSLEDSAEFRPDDRIPGAYSPLQDRYPQANVRVRVDELLRLAAEQSDNVAADMLLRLIGGPKTVTDYISSLGIEGFHLEDGERGLQRDVRAQYRNFITPAAAVQLLRRIGDNPPLAPNHAAMLVGWMSKSVKPRIAAGLPAGTDVFHKAGTSAVDAGLAHATNDIGLIKLPDGRLLAVAVLITDSRADAAARDSTIARVARAIYDAALARRAARTGTP